MGQERRRWGRAWPEGGFFGEDWGFGQWGAGCWLTSSSFSRISFSVSARGSMGSGISVVLRRESLLGGGKGIGIKGGTVVVRVTTPRRSLEGGWPLGGGLLSLRSGPQASWVGKDLGEKDLDGEGGVKAGSWMW